MFSHKTSGRRAMIFLTQVGRAGRLCHGAGQPLAATTCAAAVSPAKRPELVAMSKPEPDK
jgi:hypothetical protein